MFRVPETAFADAFMNPGGIRADLDAGEVTWGELYTQDVHAAGVRSVLHVGCHAAVGLCEGINGVYRPEDIDALVAYIEQLPHPFQRITNPRTSPGVTLPKGRSIQLTPQTPRGCAPAPSRARPW